MIVPPAAIRQLDFQLRCPTIKRRTPSLYSLGALSDRLNLDYVLKRRGVWGWGLPLGQPSMNFGKVVPLLTLSLLGISDIAFRIAVEKSWVFVRKFRSGMLVRCSNGPRSAQPITASSPLIRTGASVVAELSSEKSQARYSPVVARRKSQPPFCPVWVDPVHGSPSRPSSSKLAFPAEDGFPTTEHGR